MSDLSLLRGVYADVEAYGTLIDKVIERLGRGETDLPDPEDACPKAGTGAGGDCPSTTGALRVAADRAQTGGVDVGCEFCALKGI